MTFTLTKLNIFHKKHDYTLNSTLKYNNYAFPSKIVQESYLFQEIY